MVGGSTAAQNKERRTVFLLRDFVDGCNRLMNMWEQKYEICIDMPGGPVALLLVIVLRMSRFYRCPFPTISNYLYLMN